MVVEPQSTTLRKSQRARRFFITSNYVVYLQESEIILRIDNYPDSYWQAMQSNNFL